MVRVTSRLTPMLAETAPLWAKAVAPVAERVAQDLYWWGRTGDGRVQRIAKPTLPTPLTQSKRSAGRPSNTGVATTPAMPRVSVARTCRQCGALLRSRNRTVCSDCHDDYVSQVAMPAFEAAGPTKLAELRAQGKDPTKTPAAKAKLGATQRERQAARRVWEQGHGHDDLQTEMFQQTILPLLNSVPLSVLMKATGLSLRYCSLIRQGRTVPHPMYWDSLAALSHC